MSNYEDEFEDDVAVESVMPDMPDASELRSRTGRDVSRMLFFDLETVPDWEQVALLSDDELPPMRTPLLTNQCEEIVSGTENAVKSALAEQKPDAQSLRLMLDVESMGKSRGGVSAAIAGELKKANCEQAEFNKRCSVTPELCRICCLSWAVGGDVPQGLLCHNRDEEESALREFWQLAEQYAPLAGFNVLGFDLPVIFVRSAILGVEPSRQIELNKHSNKSVLDLMMIRYGGGGKAMGLKPSCRLMGVPIPAGDVDGSQVMQLMQDDPAKVLEYCNSDVKITRDYWWKLSGFFTF